MAVRSRESQFASSGGGGGGSLSRGSHAGMSDTLLRAGYVSARDLPPRPPPQQQQVHAASGGGGGGGGVMTSRASDHLPSPKLPHYGESLAMSW